MREPAGLLPTGLGYESTGFRRHPPLLVAFRQQLDVGLVHPCAWIFCAILGISPAAGALLAVTYLNVPLLCPFLPLYAYYYLCNRHQHSYSLILPGRLRPLAELLSDELHPLASTALL